jgi:putative flippase GtrA
MEDILWKLVKFSVVGGSGLVVDFGLTYLAKEKLRINKYVANAIGFTVAATTNFFLNKRWTFGNSSPEVINQYTLFLVIALVGLALNQIILYVVHHYFRTNFYLAKLVATVLVVFWNFTMNYLITFA